MKSKNKKRILALVLSMVLMLSTGISAMAEGEAGKGTTNGTALENQEPAVENQEENSESADTEGDKTEEIQKTAESEGQSETTEEKVEEETVSEAADLYQDFKDEDGNVITTIHAYVPEGAFQAKADQISMEAKLLDSDSENYIKRMMEEKLPENSYLGGYVLYEVNFMVDGVITEPAKAITLTIEGSGLSVTDLSKTKAFYYDPADPETEGDEDQLIDMGQKADVLNYLVENGVAEDQINTYEYSELDVQNEVAHQIGFNTWKSTIYGCYTEAYSAETAFTQEVDGVTVNVTAPEGAFPTAAENVSFTAAAVTEEQDTVISSQLDAKAEELGQEVKGYEAFALSFTVSGEEIQPRVPVSVSFENTGLPAEDVNGAQSFQLDEENRAVNELEGTVENGTASMTLSQMGTVGYWAYGDAVIEEEDSTSAEDENTPDGTEEKQPEDSVEEDSEAVTDDSQGGTDQKEDGQGSAAEDKEEESTEDGKEDTGNPDQEEDSTADTQDAEDTEGDAVENGSQDDGKSETDTSKEEEGMDTTKEDTEKEDSENKEEVKEEEKEETTEVADEAKEEDADTEKEEETSKEDSKEEAVKEMTYEDDSVTVTVSAEKEGIIPEGATLQVVPLLADDKATKDQYKEVEEKLQEKAENEEYEIAGFLAYDIFFIDKDGNEVEPEGEVKVSMDYKKAALPEGMTEEEAKEADVTMLHLEEDSKGEVKEVVDMAEKDQVETVETTESQMVKKVEVKTESFSMYTVIWKVQGREVNITAHYGYLGTGTEAEFLEFEDQAEKQIKNIGKTNDWVDLDEYSNSNIFGRDDYEYAGAYIMVDSNASEFELENATLIKALQIGSRKNKERTQYYLYYRTEKEDREQWGEALSIGKIRSVDIYYVYDKLTKVDTLDNKEYGITMTMTNLAESEQTSLLGSGGPTANHNGTTYYNVEQNVVKRTLERDDQNQGYPIVRGNKQYNREDGDSLKTLFNQNKTKAVNHLFIKNTYDQTGYFEYSSFENFAQLEKPGSNSDFIVYEQIGTPEENKSDSSFYNRGNFFPYNTIQAGKFSENRNLYDENGNALKGYEERYGERLYLTNGKECQFSMYMEAEFLQPKEGKAAFKGQRNPMVYEFNGDDDLWLFIDNVLILDIGGIHDAHSGYIDFSTGEVYVELGTDGNGDKITPQRTTIKALYQAARVFPDGRVWDDREVDKYFTGNTFKDYTRHNMKMFYMERGGGASNLHMKFNLQTIQDDTVTISKNLSNTDKEKYANENFEFELYVQDWADDWSSENPVYTNNYIKVDSTVMEQHGITTQMKQGGSDIEEQLNWTEEGKFLLKPDQSVEFSGLKENQKYYVKEVGIQENKYNEIKVNDVTATGENENGDRIETINGISTVTTSEMTVYDRAYVTFTNNCSENNSLDLMVTKEMVKGQLSIDTFTFRVSLENQNGILEPYTGTYYLVKIDEEAGTKVYYHYVNGKLEAFENQAAKDLTCGTIENGVVSGVPVGYTVVIAGLLAGTSFFVEEINLNENVYSPNYIKVLKPGTYSEENLADGADGETLLGKNAEMTIQNSYKNVPDRSSILVEKTFEGLSGTEIQELENFKITVKDSSEQDIAELGLTKESSKSIGTDIEVSGPEISGSNEKVTYTWEIKNVEDESYYISESGQNADGYMTKTTVNGGVISSAPVGIISSDYKVSTGQIPSENGSYDFSDKNLIVIQLRDESPDYVIWTKDELSVGARKGLKTVLGIGDSSVVEFFHGIKMLEETFYYRGEITLKEGKLTVKEEGDRWQSISIGSYEGEKKNEIEVLNKYQPKEIPIDLQKFGSNYDVPRDGAIFSLYKGTLSKDDSSIQWEENPMENYHQIKVTEANTRELVLQPGYYKLVETTAPAGFSLLGKDIYFRVDGSDTGITVSLIDGKGDALEDGDTNGKRMYRIVDIADTQENEATRAIQIKNEVLYDLPSAGGTGIFLYMIGGTLLLIAGSLMIYVNRRKGVLRK